MACTVPVSWSPSFLLRVSRLCGVLVPVTRFWKLQSPESRVPTSQPQDYKPRKATHMHAQRRSAP